MSDSDQQQQLHPEQQLQSNAALCAALQSVIDHSILRFDDNVDTSSECICELLRAQLSKSFAVEVVTITGTDILNNDVFTFSGRADAHEDCSVLCLSLTWDNQPLPSCSIGTVARQLSNLTFQSGVAVSHSIHVDCDGQEWVPLAMGVACGDTDSREASVFLAHSNAAPIGSRATDSGFHFSMFCTAAPGDVKNVGQDWSDVVTKCEGHWLLRDRVLGRCWPTFVLLARKVDWQSIVSERKPPSSSNSNTPSRSPSLSPAESPSPLLLLAPLRDSASSPRERHHFTEAPTRQLQLNALQAQLALIDVRESQLQHMDARAAEVETCAGWRQAAIDMSDSVCELTRQLQQRDHEILELQARRHLLSFIRLQFRAHTIAAQRAHAVATADHAALQSLSDEQLRALEDALMSNLVTVRDMQRTREEARVASAKSEVDKVTCVVCFSAERNVLLLPCKHLVLCSACASKVSACPMCRTAVQDTVACWL